MGFADGARMKTAMNDGDGHKKPPGDGYFCKSAFPIAPSTLPVNP